MRRNLDHFRELCRPPSFSPPLRDGAGMFSATAPLVRVWTTIIPKPSGSYPERISHLPHKEFQNAATAVIVAAAPLTYWTLRYLERKRFRGGATLPSLNQDSSGGPSSVMSYFAKSAAMAFGSGEALRERGPNSS
jgi:hypothetical protein